MATVPFKAGLQRLRQARADVVKSASVEAVHALRVACARLRVWAWVVKQRQLTDELRWLRASAGHVRDLDLQPRRASVRDQRAKVEQHLIDTLKSRRALKLLRELSSVSPVARRKAKRRIRKLVRDLLSDEPNWQRMGEVHRFRRVVRRVRYGLEWLGQPTRQLVLVQDALGLAHDLALTQRSRAVKRRIDEQVALARRCWRRLRPGLARWAE